MEIQKIPIPSPSLSTSSSSKHKIIITTLIFKRGGGKEYGYFLQHEIKYPKIYTPYRGIKELPVVYKKTFTETAIDTIKSQFMEPSDKNEIGFKHK